MYTWTQHYLSALERMYQNSLILLSSSATTVYTLRTTTVEWSTMMMEDALANLNRTTLLLQIATEKIERAMTLSRENLQGE